MRTKKRTLGVGSSKVHLQNRSRPTQEKSQEFTPILKSAVNTSAVPGLNQSSSMVPKSIDRRVRRAYPSIVSDPLVSTVNSQQTKLPRPLTSAMESTLSGAPNSSPLTPAPASISAPVALRVVPRPRSIQLRSILRKLLRTLSVLFWKAQHSRLAKHGQQITNASLGYVEGGSRDERSHVPRTVEETLPPKEVAALSTAVEKRISSHHNKHVVTEINTPMSIDTACDENGPTLARNMVDEGKKGTFILGGSRSSNEDESSRSSSGLVPSKSSLANQLRRETAPQPKKTTSFKDIIETRAIADEDVFESSDEEDEDAIEDDGDSNAIEEDEDEGEWEDSASESEDEHSKPPMFKRIDSSANLSSRRSLLTSMMHESDRAAAIHDIASKPQSSQSQPQLQHDNRTRSPRHTQPAGNISQLYAAEQRTAPKAIPTSPSPSSTALALSPKTTRRNMLAHELTESLRMHLLHERAIKSQVNNASRKGIERRHTTQGNLSQLRTYPKPGDKKAGYSLGAYEDKEEDEVWEHGVFGSSGEYHERGW